MNHRHRGSHKRSSLLLWLPLGLGLLGGVIALVLFTTSITPAKSVNSAPSSSSSLQTMGTTKAPAPKKEVVNQASLPSSIPQTLRIPIIDVKTPLVGLALDNAGGIQVPANPNKAGWYSLGTKPGDDGSAVVVGHIDSKTGPAVFYNLKTLEKGDKIIVDRTNGDKIQFKVAAVNTYLNEKFPARKIYTGSSKQKALNLVTCGGKYDASKGGYQSNVVVFTIFDKKL